MFRLLILVFLAAFQIFASEAKTVKVHNQKQFDEAVARVNNGEPMQIKLSQGEYILHCDIDATAPLSIIGHNATVLFYTSIYSPRDAKEETETHFVYPLKKPLSYYPLFYNIKGELVKVSESVVDSIGVNYVEREIVGPNRFFVGTTFQIPIPEHLFRLKNKSFPYTFGYLDCGWDVAKFCIENSDNDYFYCKILAESTIDNLRYDKQAYRKPIRYVLFNAELKEGFIYYDNNFIYVPKQIGPVYCTSRDVVSNQNVTIRTHSDLEIRGVSFYGLDGVEIESPLAARCIVSNSSFNNSLGRALIVKKTTGFNVRAAIIDNCSFMNCSVFENQSVFLRSNYDGDNCIVFSNCKVSKYPDGNVGYKNPRASVYVLGNATLIGNEVYNSCRDHLFLNQGKIIAKGNFLYNTDEFNAKSPRNVSCDWGLIYCPGIFNNTKDALSNTTHQVLIENNILYGAYGYAKDARGIFLDEGRGDVTCKDNIVLCTQSYSIDARSVKRTDASSIRNRYEGNIVTSHYRLLAGTVAVGSNAPITFENVLLSMDENVTSEIKVYKEDKREAVDATCKLTGNKIVVKRGLYSVIKRSDAWGDIKKHVKKHR